MDSSRCVSSSAKIGSDCFLGEFIHIADGVTIGNGCYIGDHVTISANTIIGNKVKISSHSFIGREKLQSQWSAFTASKELLPARIGNECLIGSQVVIYYGSQLGNNVLVADGAAIREEVTIGDYTIIGRSVTVEQKTTIGKRCKLETGCYITGLSIVEDYCFIAPMVTTTNDNYLGRTEERKKHFKGVTIRRGGRVGGNAVILPGMEIGADAVVAAGSVVTKNVPPGKIVMGIPARVVRNVPPEQLLENQGWE